jgi:hypothetical protein
MVGVLCWPVMRRIPGAVVQSAQAVGDPARCAACGGPHMSTSSTPRAGPGPFPRDRSLRYLGRAGPCCRCATRRRYFPPGRSPRAEFLLPQLHRAGGLAVTRGSPPHPRRLSSRHVAGDPANVRAPDRDVEGSPATPRSPTGGAAAPHAAGGSATTRGGPPHRVQLHSLDLHRSPPSGVPRRWHRRCLTDRHRQRWSDDRRIPPPGARHVVHRTPGRSPVRRRTRAAQAPANGAGPFERNGPAPQSLFPVCARGFDHWQSRRLRSAAAPFRRMNWCSLPPLDVVNSTLPTSQLAETSVTSSSRRAVHAGVLTPRVSLARR